MNHGNLQNSQRLCQGNFYISTLSSRGIYSHSRLIFDDENKLIEISTPKGNIFNLSEKDKGIKMSDVNGNNLTMDDKGIQINSSKDIVIGGKNITIKGSKVDVN